MLLIFVTIRNNKLRGAANYLLAITAFFEILHQSSHLVFLAISISGINFINYSTAIKFQLHSIFGITAAQTSMASTAADRLLSVLFPIKYNQLDIRPYLLVHTVLAFSSGIWMSINAINLSNKYPTLPVTGRIGDLFVLDMQIIFKFIMILCALNAVIYLIIWMVIRCSHKSTNSGGIPSDTQSRLLKSLILIVSIVIGGYVINSIYRLIVNQFFKLNDIQNWSIGMFGGTLLNIGASAETPILYIFSSIYREAINKQLKRFLCKKFQKNKISAAPGFVNCSGVKTKQLINGGGGGGGIVNNNNVYPKT
ncbi:unnamed protein product [Meloidogyne enterolobii]|uniref:Uncharacterized protein n=2 Tax=Meloidogyne enterolobii TaxID=390850 RepID=A0ACB0Z1N0_MELEN